MSQLYASASVLLTAIALSTLYLLTGNKRPRRNYPPGPKPSWIPLVGNLKEFRALEDEELYFQYVNDLKPIYGEEPAALVVQIPFLTTETRTSTPPRRHSAAFTYGPITRLPQLPQILHGPPHARDIL